MSQSSTLKKFDTDHVLWVIFVNKIEITPNFILFMSFFTLPLTTAHSLIHVTFDPFDPSR